MGGQLLLQCIAAAKDAQAKATTANQDLPMKNGFIDFSGPLATGPQQDALRRLQTAPPATECRSEVENSTFDEFGATQFCTSRCFDMH